MKNLFKGKVGTVLILLATLALAGVAIYTAIRLYQLRQQPVAPNVPSSIPHASEVCGGITGATCSGGQVCIYSDGTTKAPFPDASGSCGTAPAVTNTKTVTNSCSLSFSLTAATATPTATPTSTPTPTATATSTPVPQCNDVCTTDAQCSGSLTCSSGHCRNTACTGEASCVCATATPTATPTGTPNSCNGTCGSNFNCQNGLMCYQGFCRNPSCTTNTSCACGGATNTPTPTPTQPALPNTGVDWPTTAGFGIGIFVILGSLLLAL